MYKTVPFARHRTMIWYTIFESKHMSPCPAVNRFKRGLEYLGGRPVYFVYQHSHACRYTLYISIDSHVSAAINPREGGCHATHLKGGETKTKTEQNLLELLLFLRSHPCSDRSETQWKAASKGPSMANKKKVSGRSAGQEQNNYFRI